MVWRRPLNLKYTLIVDTSLERLLNLMHFLPLYIAPDFIKRPTKWHPLMIKIFALHQPVKICVFICHDRQIFDAGVNPVHQLNPDPLGSKCCFYLIWPANNDCVVITSI